VGGTLKGVKMSYFRSINQAVTESAGNSDTSNLPKYAGGDATGADTFIGTAESTLGVNAIQIGLKTDKTCYVWCEQSNDTLNWDISDRYNYYPGFNFGITTQAISAYVRTKVRNLQDTSTSYLRLSTVLCPIVEAVPRTLSEEGNLKVSLCENTALVSTLNTTGNIAGLTTFTGTFEGITNQSAIQVISKYNQNTTIYVDQSIDGVTATITDTFYGFANSGVSEVVSSVAPYYRIRIVNTSATQATGNLVSAKTVLFSPLPRTLDINGNLKISSPMDLYGFSAENTPMGEMRAAIPSRLIGATFTGSTLDSSFWTSTLGTGGTAAVGNAQVILSTGVTANNNTTLQTTRTARYVGGASNRFRGVMRLPDTTAIGNIRKWGAFDGVDGAYFQLSDTTAGVTTIKSGVPTVVNSGSFNGSLGAVHAFDTTVRTWEIYWTNSKAYFVIGDEVLHTVTASDAPWASTLHLPVRFENDSTNGGTTNVGMNIRSGTIYRLGSLVTQPSSRYISGLTTQNVLKLGPGNIHSVNISGIVTTAVCTIYDNTAASGTILWSSGTMTVPASQANNFPYNVDFKGAPFFNGLTIAITTAACNATVIYE